MATVGRPRGRGRGSVTPRQQHQAERLSQPTENYLLSLYILREEGVSATPGALVGYLRRRIPASEGLGTSLPTVTGMVHRLEREGHVETTPEKEIHLTERGLVLAEDIVRRHRLAERLVVDLLGVELADAHAEAHRLEHAISPGLQAKIIERLGNPKTCPFGRPIPGSGYHPTGPPAVSLEAAVPGQRYRVDRVPEEEQELLRFLVQSRMVPGALLRVLDAARYRGVLTVEVDGRPVALGYEVAARVWVQPEE
ncbi:MAG: metal-dependent transcriptional regulator [Chloroflexi bacterium]|nr:metal-dependent transcriptional regulator [Chloroflexota bacterium]